MDKKRIGILLSYINLAVGMLINVFLTPFLIKTLGDVDYSIYKVMQSFAGPLSMFHFGISTIVTRSIVKNNTMTDYSENDKKNTMALSLIASSVMALIVIALGMGMYLLIPSIYGKNYDRDSIDLARKIFILFVCSTVFHIMTDAFSGCMNGHEQYHISSAIPLVKNGVKVLLLIILLRCGVGVIAVVAVDLVIAIGTFFFSAWYAMDILHEIPKLTHWDKREAWEILTYGLAIFFQAIVNQVNNNVDNIILGAFIEEKWMITMYSSALAIYSVYNSLISVIQNFFLPKATALVAKNATGAEMTDFVIAPGRFQAVIAIGVIFGFALFGRNFITLWIGEKYLNAYWIVLMLIIPVTIPLVENTAISILDATLKRTYRSIVLLGMAALNVVVSLLLVKRIGYWGAAIGTVASLIIGQGFLMNYYYARTFKMEIGRMFCSIFKGILPSGAIAALICIPTVIFIPSNLGAFLVKCLFFVAIYMGCLWLCGINQKEKETIKGIIFKVSK